MLDALTADVEAILVPNSMFYEHAPTDRNKYLVGPEMIAALSWVAVTIVVPAAQPRHWPPITCRKS
ncbi:hypothetical protein U8Q05_26995 (plasmid) [Rhizobium ruizarguesonis]|nr:hypothetical protein U8Q05_26995 [Rhizobium ruizarguesonis]